MAVRGRLIFATTLALLAGPVLAADPCDGFSWNVAHERAVFATSASPVTAATAPGVAPTLEPDHLYEVTLAPQDKVSFAMAPAKKALADGAFGGLLHLHVPVAGQYRVSMDNGFWIDVIADGKFAATDDFTGSHECHAPRKIVMYTLPAGSDLTLQFSGANSPTVRVTLTAAPISK